MADDPIAAWRALLLAHSRALRAIEREMEEAGVISLTWYDVLLELSAAPHRRLRMQDLGDRVVLSRSRVSRVVDDLVGAGLVRRDPDPTDGRATLATLTAPGRAALRQAAPVYMRGIERHFTGLLSADERQHVARALDKVVRAHDVIAPPRRR